MVRLPMLSSKRELHSYVFLFSLIVTLLSKGNDCAKGDKDACACEGRIGTLCETLMLLDVAGLAF
jgi:hypothetical protein